MWTPIPPGLGRAQDLAKEIAGWAFRWYAALRVRGAANVPARGPVILAANHRSMLDVPLLVVAAPRRVHFVAKAGLFKNPIVGWLFHELGGFPISPGAPDHRALRTALAILERGGVVGIYPEGTRSKTGQMLPFMRGAAWLALRIGAPIVPCGITGTAPGLASGWRDRVRKRVTIAFGPPLPVPREVDPGVRRRRAQAITAELLEAVTRLAA